MVKQQYPRVEINLGYLRENVEQIVKRCAEQGVEIAGVIKGTTGIPECAQMYAEGGAKMIASSRLEQIEDAIEKGIDLPKLLLRVPMLSEVDEAVRLCDISLNSEIEVMRALDAAAGKQGKRHGVIIMADLGDLREGYWDKDEMTDVAEIVEKELPNLDLLGVGTNLGCYGSVDASPEKLQELVEVAEKIEARIGRQLRYISGGATTSLPRILQHNMPERVNLLRVGEGILLSRDLPLYWGHDFSFMHQDVYTLKAEIIEIKDKPTHPVGTLTVDAFGRTPVYEDRGIRKRALLGIGKVDYGDIADIFPHDERVQVIGASSDHTILDVEDAGDDYKLGDIVSFNINYASLVYVTNCRNVQHVFV